MYEKNCTYFFTAVVSDILLRCRSLNYAFSVNGIKGRAKPVVGYVYYNGMNLNEYSSLLPEKWKNFTKDHDFAEVKLSDGKTIFVDPTLDIIQK